MNKNLLKKFLSSFEYDKILAKYDIDACIVWTETLAKNKIVEKEKAKKVINVLKQLKKQTKEILPEEDIHFAVEKTLEKFLVDKELAGIIRTARSRNDLVVSDERMFIKEEILNIQKLLKNLILSIVKLAEKNLYLPMVGYTHLQPAQPVLFSHYVLAFAWWLLRDIDRLKDCYKRTDFSVLGSAAFAGSGFDIDRKEVAKKLGFKEVSKNSVDSVSDRDFMIEFVFCCAVIMMHLSRIAEEFIIWCSPNFGYITLPKELTSGSSIMPQKQNPDYLELIRGKSAKVYSDLVGILVLLKGLPLSYNRDMQEDKVYLVSTLNTVKDCLEVMKIVFDSVKINKEKMISDIKQYDFIFATDVANFLVKEVGIPYKLAHKKVQKLIEYCIRQNKKLCQLGYNDYVMVLGKNVLKDLHTKLLEIFDLDKAAKHYKTYGGSSVQQVKIQIKTLKNSLKFIK